MCDYAFSLAQRFSSFYAACHILGENDAAVRAFAEEMVRDHAAVNDKALALVGKLGVKPEANPTSTALSAQAAQKRAELGKLDGAAFDRAYVANEVA